MKLDIDFRIPTTTIGLAFHQAIELAQARNIIFSCTLSGKVSRPDFKTDADLRQSEQRSRSKNGEVLFSNGNRPNALIRVTSNNSTVPPQRKGGKDNLTDRHFIMYRFTVSLIQPPAHQRENGRRHSSASPTIDGNSKLNYAEPSYGTIVTIKLRETKTILRRTTFHSRAKTRAITGITSAAAV